MTVETIKKILKTPLTMLTMSERGQPPRQRDPTLQDAAIGQSMHTTTIDKLHGHACIVHQARWVIQPRGCDVHSRVIETLVVRVPLLVGFAGVGSTVVPWAATPLQWPSSAATPLAVLCTLIGEERVL